MHLNASWVSGRLEHLEAGEGKLRQDKISLETRWDTSLSGCMDMFLCYLIASDSIMAVSYSIGCEV